MTPERLSVSPGGEVTAEISVTNTGSVVDSYAVQVLDPVAGWARCEPESLSLFPGKSGQARLVIRLPAGSDTPVGDLPFAVRVTSSEDPEGSVVEEATLAVGAVTSISAEMSPRVGRTRGMRARKHRVAVDNRGNAAGLVRFSGSDEQDSLDLSFHPPELEVAAGSAAFAEVRVRAERRFWRGQTVTHRFHVDAHPPEGTPTRMEGSLLQEAALPSWLPKVAALVTLGAAAVVLLWFTVLKPVVTDVATNAGTAATKQELNKVLQGGQANSAGRSSGNGSAGGGTSGSAGAGATPTPTPAATNSAPKIVLPAPVPFARELTSAHSSLTAAAKKQLSVTDLVLQNPAGDKGTLTVSRAGTVLITLRLENFRDYDLHFVTPITVPAGQSLTMSVNCQNTGGTACTPAALISGMSHTIAL